MCNGKKSKFLKEQEARGLLNRLGIRTRNKNTLPQIPLLGNLLF